MEAIFKALASKGKILYNNIYDLEKYCLENDGTEIMVSIKPFAKTGPKLRLYAYYHGPLLDYALKAYSSAGYEGMDKVKVDYMLRAEFAKDFILKPDGEAIPIMLDKSKMTKERLTKYVSDCLFHLEQEFQMEPPDSESYKINKATGRNFTQVKD